MDACYLPTPTSHPLAPTSHPLPPTSYVLKVRAGLKLMLDGVASQFSLRYASLLLQSHGSPILSAKLGVAWAGIYHESDSELTRLQARVWAAYNSVCGRHLSAAIATAFALKPPPPRPAPDECALSWRLPVASQVRGRAGLIRAWHRARARVRRGGPTHLRRHRVDVRRSQASQRPSPLRCLEHALRLAAASSPCSPTARRGASAASSGRRSWRGSRRTQHS